MTPTIDQHSVIETILNRYRQEPGALLCVLHAIQNALGYIPPESVPTIGDALQITRAEVHGVISFYHEFRTQPAGCHTVQLCRAEACQAVGARALEAHVTQKLGVNFHETTADGSITLEPVFCLGNCACGPSVRIGDTVYGRVNRTRVDALLAALRVKSALS